jgi:flagellar assembly factor FliW
MDENETNTPRGPMVKIESTRFGNIEVPEETILTFPAGMIGFGDLNRYAIVKQREDSVFLWLQCVDDGALAFPIVLPWVFYWDYEVQLSDEDMQLLDVERADQISIYCVVRVTPNVREATINLFSPVVVNNQDRTARQILNAVEGYSTRDPLFRSDDGPTPVSMREDESPNVVLLGRD